jgi:hypothetical protein
VYTRRQADSHRAGYDNFRGGCSIFLIDATASFRIQEQIAPIEQNARITGSRTFSMFGCTHSSRDRRDCCGRTYSTEKVNLEPGEGIRQGWVNQERSAHTLDGKKKDGSQARDPDRQSSPRPRQTRRLGRSSQIAISNCRRSRRPWLNVSSRPV